MNKIIRLPQEIAGKIAAGEVIERPASVVKELVENSLDAGAFDIRVELINGGKSLIRVVDNGAGMSREDARLCFERHSTSKISSEEDLQQIMTLGFRGEALPSISAVSRVVMKTSVDGRKGVLIRREGECLLEVEDIAFPRGTSVEVRNLFFNLPARRKFLKSDQSELKQAVRFLTASALVNPEKRFLLRRGSREVFHYPGVESLKERLFQIYGRDVLERLVEIELKDGDYLLSGFASRPLTGRGDRAHQMFFVNRRWVKDRLLQSALSQAYRGFMEKDRHPEAWLFLKIPPRELDVNVHPAKAEVRFRSSQTVFHLVRRGVELGLRREMGIKEASVASAAEASPSEVKEKPLPGSWQTPFETSFSPREERLPSSEEARPHHRVLGQAAGMYIVVESEEGLLVIDQHNAHERILFENYKKIHEKKKWPVKTLLIPPLVELSPAQILSLEENGALLEEAGFRAEDMGQRSFALKELPDILKEEDAKNIFLSLLEDIKEGGLEEKKKKLLATMACKTAVKAGEPLSFSRMNYLVEELFKTSNPSLCPHGRPVMLKLSRKEIEKNLKR